MAQLTWRLTRTLLRSGPRHVVPTTPQRAKLFTDLMPVHNIILGLFVILGESGTDFAVTYAGFLKPWLGRGLYMVRALTVHRISSTHSDRLVDVRIVSSNTCATRRLYNSMRPSVCGNPRLTRAILPSIHPPIRLSSSSFAMDRAVTRVHDLCRYSWLR